MRRILLPFVCTLALVACNGTDPEATATAPTAADAPESGVAELARIPPGAPLNEALPDGMEFDFAFNTVYDKVLTTKQGEPRRRVIVEFLEGSVESTSESLRDDLVAIGYRAGKLRDEEGGIRINYSRRDDGARVSVLTRPVIDQRLRDPMARGTVSLSFVPPTVETAADAGVDTP